MTEPAYYNEIDPFAAATLRNLIDAGHIAPGYVDERSIVDVKPSDLTGFAQCHFFAGIGVWSYALRRAGWADGRRVWTGSCPCQPFSQAGEGNGFADERHLWPYFFHLITNGRPDVFLGEQVASLDGLAWLDLVLSDLEAADYTGGAVDLCAAGVGAPHIRQRQWIVGVANTYDAGSQGRGLLPQRANQFAVGAGSMVSRVANTDGERRRHGWESQGSDDVSSWGETTKRHICGESSQGFRLVGDAGPTNGHWRNADWLGCSDGKWRPVEPGTFPLVNGTAGRVGRLRAYGNAINAEAATAFIRAVMECLP